MLMEIFKWLFGIKKTPEQLREAETRLKIKLEGTERKINEHYFIAGFSAFKGDHETRDWAFRKVRGLKAEHKKLTADLQNLQAKREKLEPSSTEMSAEPSSSPNYIPLQTIGGEAIFKVVNLMKQKCEEGTETKNVVKVKSKAQVHATTEDTDEEGFEKLNLVTDEELGELVQDYNNNDNKIDLLVNDDSKLRRRQSTLTTPALSV